MLPTYVLVYIFLWAGWLSWYSNWLQTGWSRDQILVGTRFSAPVQIGPGAYPAFCTMGTGSFPGAKSGRGVTLTTHPLLMSWWRKSRAIPLLPLWAVQPVQSLSACTGVHFTFTITAPSVPVQGCTLPTFYLHIFLHTWVNKPRKKGTNLYALLCSS